MSYVITFDIWQSLYYELLRHFSGTILVATRNKKIFREKTEPFKSAKNIRELKEKTWRRLQVKTGF